VPTTQALRFKFIQDQKRAGSNVSATSFSIAKTESFKQPATEFTGKIPNDGNYRRGSGGLENKTERTASIRVLRQTRGGADPYQNIFPAFSKMLIEQVREGEEEYLQIVKTFESFKIFFFGEKPQIIQISGKLLNSKNHDWYNDFYFTYENYLRGTRCVENNAKAYLQFDDVLVEGYIINFNTVKEGFSNNMAPFSMGLLKTYRTPLNIGEVSERNRQIVDSAWNIQAARERKRAQSETVRNIIRGFYGEGKTAGEVS
jgi:hypothetical protein